MEVLAPFAIFALFAAVVVAAILAQRFQLGSRRYWTLADVVEDLRQLTRLDGRAPGEGFLAPSTLEAVRLDGRLAGGRRAKLRFSQTGSGKSKVFHVEASVAADEAPSLTVTEEGILTGLAKWLGLQSEIEVGDPRFDRRFLLETPGTALARESAARALRAGELRESIHAAFDRFHLEKLELGAGQLVATARARDLEPALYAELLDQLDRMARRLDRVPIHVRVLGGERRALCEPGGKMRCAYCHEGVHGDDPDLVACKRCSTVLHDACWRELGRCPVLGCTGRDPERARTS